MFRRFWLSLFLILVLSSCQRQQELSPPPGGLEGGWELATVGPPIRYESSRGTIEVWVETYGSAAAALEAGRKHQIMADRVSFIADRYFVRCQSLRAPPAVLDEFARNLKKEWFSLID